MSGAKLKKTRQIIMTTPLLDVVCHRMLKFDSVYCIRNLTILALAVPETSLGRQHFKWVT